MITAFTLFYLKINYITHIMCTCSAFLLERVGKGGGGCFEPQPNFEKGEGGGGGGGGLGPQPNFERGGGGEDLTFKRGVAVKDG